MSEFAFTPTKTIIEVEGYCSLPCGPYAFEEMKKTLMRKHFILNQGMVGLEIWGEMEIYSVELSPDGQRAEWKARNFIGEQVKLHGS